MNNQKEFILFRIPFTRIFVGFVTCGTFKTSWFDFFKRAYKDGEWCWEEI